LVKIGASKEILEKYIQSVGLKVEIKSRACKKYLRNQNLLKKFKLMKKN
jgi:hypothetical protein